MQASHLEKQGAAGPELGEKEACSCEGGSGVVQALRAQMW